MPSKPKKAPKYQLTLILKDEYKKPGRPDKFELEGNSLDKILSFAHRHTGRYKHPWLYMGIWRNATFNPYHSGKILFWTRLP